jgi:hypothetical protein
VVESDFINNPLAVIAKNWKHNCTGDQQIRVNCEIQMVYLNRYEQDMRN